jgi:hypothetical protein
VKTRSTVYHMTIRTGKLPLLARVRDWNVIATLELMLRMDRFAGQVGSCTVRSHRGCGHRKRHSP